VQYFGGVLLLIGLGLFALAVHFERRHRMRVANLRLAVQALAADYPFLLSASAGMSFLCMDSEGVRIRFTVFRPQGIEIEVARDLVVPIADVQSVELSGGDTTVTDYVTVSRKQGALGRAAMGGLLFGGAGAIVGSTSAGSKSRSVANLRTIRGLSVLTFALADLSNPIVRFKSWDRAQSEQWLNRVRAAIAKHRSGSALNAQLSTS